MPDDQFKPSIDVGFLCFECANPTRPEDLKFCTLCHEHICLDCLDDHEIQCRP